MKVSILNKTTGQYEGIDWESLRLVPEFEPKRGVNDLYITPTEKQKLDATEVFTNAEKTQGALATGNAVLPTLKNVADRTDGLLVDFTVPQDAPSLTFDRDKNGVLFTGIDLKSISITINCKGDTGDPPNSSALLRINNIQSGWLTSGSQVIPSGIRFIHSYIGTTFIYVYINNIIMYMSFSDGYTTEDNAAGTQNLTFRGLNTNTVGKINSVQIIAPPPREFKLGTSIKIYRND